MITFLHTAQPNVKRFEDLVRKYDQSIEIKHFVNEELLTSAMQSGQADDYAFLQEAEKVKAQSNGLIICTCSTYGEACDQVPGIERIDKPVVEYLVSKYHKIGLAYTAKSTWLISRNLVYQVARQAGKDVEVIELDFSECWPHFVNGEAEVYEKAISARIREDISDCEAIFLAQASMEGARQHLASFPKEIMSSPDYGVQTYLKVPS